jgi:hypothetical protein
MDSYRSRRDDKQPSQGGPRVGQGTGQLQTDSLHLNSSGRLRLSPRKASASLVVVDQLLERFEAEVNSGKLLLLKLKPRIAVLTRALRVLMHPAEAASVFQGVAPGEADFTRRVVQLLQEKRLILRQVQIACFQYEQADKGLEQAAEHLATALLYEGSERVTYFEHYCHIEKLRGQLYPMINLPLVFKNEPLLAQLLPEPRESEEPVLPPPPPPKEPVAVEPPQTGGIGHILKQDPAVAQLLGGLRQLTGQLKDGLRSITGQPRSR